MRKIVVIIFLFFLTGHTYGQKVNWISFDEAVKLTKENPKPMLIDVYRLVWLMKKNGQNYLQ